MDVILNEFVLKSHVDIFVVFLFSVSYTLCDYYINTIIIYRLYKIKPLVRYFITFSM